MYALFWVRFRVLQPWFLVFWKRKHFLDTFAALENNILRKNRFSAFLESLFRPYESNSSWKKHRGASNSLCKMLVPKPTQVREPTCECKRCSSGQMEQWGGSCSHRRLDLLLFAVQVWFLTQAKYRCSTDPVLFLIYRELKKKLHEEMVARSPASGLAVVIIVEWQST